MALLWTVCDKNQDGAVVLTGGEAFIKKEYSDEFVSQIEEVTDKLCYFTEQHMEWHGSVYGDRVDLTEDEEEIPVTDAVICDGKLVGFCPLHSPWDIENHKEKFYISVDDVDDELKYFDPYPLFDEKKEGERWETYTLISLMLKEHSEAFSEN